jgi:hypothetical protein
MKNSNFLFFFVFSFFSQSGLKHQPPVFQCFFFPFYARFFSFGKKCASIRFFFSLKKMRRKKNADGNDFFFLSQEILQLQKRSKQKEIFSNFWKLFKIEKQKI